MTADSHPTTPPDSDRLDDLGQDIDEIRNRVEDPLDQGDQHFVDSEDTDDGLTDDTIV